MLFQPTNLSNPVSNNITEVESEAEIQNELPQVYDNGESLYFEGNVY